jgi:hypothetical protein
MVAHLISWMVPDFIWFAKTSREPDASKSEIDFKILK